MMRRWPLIACILVLPLLAMAAPAASPEIDSVRPLSDAERTAVELAIQYLEGGGQALLHDLAADSPLRALPEDEAVREIEARAGPAVGAQWRLQTVVPAASDTTAAFTIDFPSGIDESLTMRLVREEGGYRLHDLSILAEPSPWRARAEAIPGDLAGQLTPDRTPILLTGLIALGLALMAGTLGRRVPRLIPYALVASVALFSAGLFWLARSDPAFFSESATLGTTASEIPASSFPRLGHLVDARRAVALGEPIPDGARHEVLALWAAQLALHRSEFDRVEADLDAFPAGSDIPLVEILRARVAFLRSRESTAVIAYEHAINAGPGRDGLWYEAAESFSILGFEDRARAYLERLARIGTREANVYYALAAFAARDEELEPAQANLRKGWSLEPAERSAIIDAGVFWELLRDSETSGLFRMNDAGEPRVRSEQLSTRAVTLPERALPVVTGEMLEIRLGESLLQVPGGAALAPDGVRVVDAYERTLDEEQRFLEQLPQLLRSAEHPGAFSQPLLRQKIEKTAAALSRHNQWNDLIRLTSALSAGAENAPVDLLFLKASALIRTRNENEAKRLLAQMATNPSIRRRRDPQVMMTLGELFARVELYEPAIRMMEIAGSMREIPWLDDRIRQIATNRRLSSSYGSHRTEHFRIRFPEEVGRHFPARIGEILESERRRLLPLIPLPEMKPVTVRILWWEEFRSTYTGSDHILGFYDGEITLPFAGVPQFDPQVVSILTHELAHAMLGQATADHAPRWFQEGLATRVEMLPYHANAFNRYPDESIFAVTLLDSIIGSSPDPEMVQAGYLLSHAVVRFIESRYGSDGLQRMIRSFRDGATTPEAIEDALGASVSSFESAFRDWGRSQRDLFHNPQPTRYDVNPVAIRSREIGR